MIEVTSLEAIGDMTDAHLDAVDFAVIPGSDNFDPDASVCRFRLNGLTYVVTENPDDGYRSSMRDITVDRKPERLNTFEKVLVHTAHSASRQNLIGDRHYSSGDCDILQVIDTESGQPILTVGTDYSDDYYPSFVAHFQPENISPGSWARFVAIEEEVAGLTSTSPDYASLEDFGTF